MRATAGLPPAKPKPVAAARPPPPAPPPADKPAPPAKPAKPAKAAAAGEETAQARTQRLCKLLDQRVGGGGAGPGKAPATGM
jgi:hypothetical protein